MLQMRDKCKSARAFLKIRKKLRYFDSTCINSEFVIVTMIRFIRKKPIYLNIIPFATVKLPKK
jgi:hypothetical protein